MMNDYSEEFCYSDFAVIASGAGVNDLGMVLVDQPFQITSCPNSASIALATRTYSLYTPSY